MLDRKRMGRLEWTSAALRGRRQVSHLIVRERDAKSLTAQACDALVDSGSFDACCIVPFSDGKPAVVAHAGAVNALRLDEMLLDGVLSGCMMEALERGEMAFRTRPCNHCLACLSPNAVSERATVTVPLQIAGEVYGVMLAIVWQGVQLEDEDRFVIADVATDLAYALRNIDLERQSVVVEAARREEHEQLRATKDRLDALIHHAPSAILALDVDGNVTLWNPAGERMYGWSEAEALGRPLPFVPSDMRGETRALVARNLAGEVLSGVELAGVRRDGSAVEISLYAAPLRDASGSVIGCISVNVDVTARKRTQRAASESDRRLSTLIANLPGMAYRCRNDGRWIMEFVSEGCRDLTGYSSAELTGPEGVAYADLIHPDDRDIVWARVTLAIRDRQHFVFDYRIRDRQGVEKWVWEKGAPVFDDAGNLQAIEGFIADINEKKLAHDAAKLSEARLEALYTLGQATFDSEKELIDYALEELVRLTGSELGYFRMVREEPANPSSVRWSRWTFTCAESSGDHCLLNSESIWGLSARSMRPEVQNDFQHATDASCRVGHCEINRHLSVPIVTDGVVQAVCGVANKHAPYDDSDVRQLQLFLDGLWKLLQKKREQERRQVVEEQQRISQKMEAIGRLAGGIAHDFNNTLAAINGYADLLLQDAIQGDSMYDDLLEIRKAGSRAASLTRQLLAFGRKQVLAPEVLDLNHVVIDLKKMLHRLLGEAIELCAELEPSLHFVKVDRGQIEQVLVNLVVNARDALLPRGGTLVVQTANATIDDGFAAQYEALAPGDYVVLRVSDDGAGMDELTKSRLFEPFFTTKVVGRGTGLGLATVHGIVRQSGGGIIVDSTLGKGTTFHVYLPVVDAAAETSSPPKSIAPAARGVETVLVVEDEDAVRALACRLLAASGYHVVAAASGLDALDTCESLAGAIDLMLTDVMMPQMSGKELADRVARRWPAIKVVFMSAHPEETIAHHGVLDEGTVFIAKPFSASLLTRKVRQALDT